MLLTGPESYKENFPRKISLHSILSTLISWQFNFGPVLAVNDTNMTISDMYSVCSQVSWFKPQYLVNIDSSHDGNILDLRCSDLIVRFHSLTKAAPRLEKDIAIRTWNCDQWLTLLLMEIWLIVVLFMLPKMWFEIVINILCFSFSFYLIYLIIYRFWRSI